MKIGWLRMGGPQLTARRFLLDNTLLWLGMMVLNAATYGAQVFVGRALGQQQFGEFIAFVSIVSLLFLPMASIQTMVARQGACLVASGLIGDLPDLAVWWIKRAAILGIAGALICLVASRPLAAFMQMAAVWPIALLAPAALAGVFLAVVRGLWQGAQRFGRLAANLALEGVCRLGLAVLLALATRSGAGAASSYGLASVVALLVAFPLLGRRREVGAAVAAASSGMNRPILVASLGLMLLPNIDIIVVKHLFSPDAAGTYAAVTFVGRIALFATSSIPMVMLPKILQEGVSSQRRVYIAGVSLLLVIATSGAILIGPVLWPAWFANLIFGPGFTIGRQLMIAYGIFVTLYAVLTTWTNLYFAVGRANIQRVITGALVAACGLLGVFHGTLLAVVLCMGVALALAVVFLLGDTLHSRAAIFGLPAGNL